MWQPRLVGQRYLGAGRGDRERRQELRGVGDISCRPEVVMAIEPETKAIPSQVWGFNKSSDRLEDDRWHPEDAG